MKAAWFSRIRSCSYFCFSHIYDNARWCAFVCVYDPRICVSTIIIICFGVMLLCVLKFFHTLRKLAHAILYRCFFSCTNLKFNEKDFDIFNIFAQNIYCGYTLEPPRQGGSNEYPQSLF